jgi:hypothetical protein
LRIFRQSFVVQSSIERVWHFYTNVKHLEIITPKQMDLEIIKTTSEFELPYGVLGKLFEGYAYKQLQNIFEYRKIATVKALE